jgi:hypothetical protein
MPKKRRIRSKLRTRAKTKVINRNKYAKTNNVHVHVEKSKTRKKRIKTKVTKIEPNNNPLSKSINAMSRGSSQNLVLHPRGSINYEIQQPTIVQQLHAPPDPRIEKLNKKTKKIKEFLKGSKKNDF